MRYKTYPGTILTSCCGQNYIITPHLSIEVNETATFYWKYLEKGITKGELLDRVIEEYDIEDSHLLEEEIDCFLKSLLDKKLLYEG